MSEPTTLLLDTGILSALFEDLGSTEAKRKAAQSFLERQIRKRNVLVCPPISRIEFHKEHFRRTKQSNISERINQLATNGIIFHKEFDTANHNEYCAIFDNATKYYATRPNSLADAFLAAEAAATRSVVITFDPDFKEKYRDKEVMWFNPEQNQYSTSDVKRRL